ncbi:MAG: hypothetical protein V4694_02720 [Pseudomonadota bacterium]
MLRKTFTILLLLSFSACDFQVIYKEKVKGVGVTYAQDLSAIRIKKDRTKLSQDLKNNLYDALNPDYIKSEPKYFLILAAKSTISSTFTTFTGASGRNRVTLDVVYTLKSLDNAITISSGTTSVNDNYDVTTNRYGTYTAEQYILTNLTKIAAQNIRNSLVNDFIEVRKKCEGLVKLKEDEKFVCPFTEEEIKERAGPKKK